MKGKVQIVFILFVFIISCSAKPAESRYDILSWARMPVDKFGCMLENEFGYRDKKFNCSLVNYKNKSTPCNAKEYYEGLIFPKEKVQSVHSKIDSIGLDFEHGDLRRINIVFKENLPILDVQRMFRLPRQNDRLPENVMKITFSENISSKEKKRGFTKWLSIVGFEHMGAGEMVCE